MGWSYLSLVIHKGWTLRSFSEEEVRNALRHCCGDKAPGPDGMTMAFIQDN